MTVTVFTRTTCGPCKTVKYFLQKKGIQFTEQNVDENPSLIDQILEMTGIMQVPMTVIDGQPVSGADFAKLSRLIANA